MLKKDEQILIFNDGGKNLSNTLLQSLPLQLSWVEMVTVKVTAFITFSYSASHLVSSHDLCGNIWLC